MQSRMVWLKEFLDKYFKGDRESAYQLKHKNIPNRLYKYQTFEEVKLKSLLDHKIWFSNPNNLNDPFDCYGVHWDEQELHDHLKQVIPPEKFNSFSTVNEIVDGAINSLRDHVKLTCFSENLLSMPMWAHYAGNHNGFCIEYDFTSLDWEHAFSKFLFPVGYESNRYNITNLIKETFEPEPSLKINLLFFLMQIKHESWSYEKEWRIMLHSDNSTSGLIKCPVKPKAIYFGMNCNKYDEYAKALNQQLNCPIYKLSRTNSKFFELIEFK